MDLFNLRLHFECKEFHFDIFSVWRLRITFPAICFCDSFSDNSFLFFFGILIPFEFGNHKQSMKASNFGREKIFFRLEMFSNRAKTTL